MRSKDAAGYSLIELLCALAIVGLLSVLVTPALDSALRRSRTNALVADGRVLLLAFKAYCASNDRYPASSGRPSQRLDRRTLAPLTDSGLLRNGPAFTQDLEDGELSVYRSHDNGRHGTGFHAELVLARDSRVRVLVADTDRYPGARGLRLDGVYILADGEILTPPARP